MNELKPCPFCGAPAQPDKRIINGVHGRVFCSNEDCFAWGPESMSDEVFVWNSRPIEDTLSAHITELEAENAALEARLDVAEHNALKWTTYDGTHETAPDKSVDIILAEMKRPNAKAEIDVYVRFGASDEWELAYSGMLLVMNPGDRWAYLPTNKGE